MTVDRSYGAAYRRAVARQLWWRGDAGFDAAVGGLFNTVGALERDLVDAAGLPAEGFLIDVGCGSGRLASALRDRERLHYLGLDVAPDLLQRASDLSARPDWHFARVYGPAIPTDDEVADVVAMFSVITHISEQETREYLREVKRVLKRGSAVVLSFLDPTIKEHRALIRPAWIEAIVTRLAWAPNVATRVDQIRAWAVEAGLSVEHIESPSTFGQSLARLRKN